MKPEVKAFFHAPTWTLTYVAWDPESRDAIVVDAVLDYDPAASRLSTRAVDEIAAFVLMHGLKLHWLLDTHAHADHFTGSRALKARFPEARVGIGARIREVQATFRQALNLGDALAADGSQFDALLADDETLQAGTMPVRAIATPGHTPACMCFLAGEDALFTGDTLFMPDYGVGRCDFPAGSAEALYDSITTRIFALPDATRVFVGHDYQPGGRDLLWESTVGEERRHNVQLRPGMTREAFVEFRRARDSTLGAPRLLYPSVQFNVNGGQMPRAEENGVSYLKIPLRA